MIPKFAIHLRFYFKIFYIIGTSVIFCLANRCGWGIMIIYCIAMNKGGGDMQKVIETLFPSENFFWLATALATGLAAEEMERFYVESQDAVNTVDTTEIVELFYHCVRSNEMTEEEMQQAKAWSIGNLQLIDSWNRKTPVFHEWKSLGISKGFTAYWLNYKLIELEWQQILGTHEVEEIYLFLDQVLLDSEELQEIEQACISGTINEDQRMFLRSHWQRSRLFWTNLYMDLQLLALGIIEMRQPELAQR